MLVTKHISGPIANFRTLAAQSSVKLGSAALTIDSNRTCKVHLFYNDMYEVQLPATHRFPMEKYKLVREMLQGEFACDERVVFAPSPEATAAELASTHCPRYVQRYMRGLLTNSEVRCTGFPWSEAHVRRSTSSVGGTVAATRTLLSSDAATNGWLMAGHIAGGTHHAFFDRGEGFCIFSDIAVAANIALREYPEVVNRIVIIDLDVHQGNGNAVLFQNEERVFTFSMHCSGNYFSAKQRSNLDVEIAPGAGDVEYLSRLRVWLPYLVDVLQPDLVFYQAGVDVFKEDRLGKLALSRTAISRRNQILFNLLVRKRIKCVVTMGGGYPRDE